MLYLVGRFLGSILGSGSTKRKRQEELEEEEEEVNQESCDDNGCRCCRKRRKLSCEKNLRSEETNTSNTEEEEIGQKSKQNVPVPTTINTHKDASGTSAAEGTSTTSVNIGNATASIDSTISSNSGTVHTTLPLPTITNVANPTITAVETNATAEKTVPNSTPTPTTSAIKPSAVKPSVTTETTTAKDTVEATGKPSNSTETIAKNSETAKAVGNAPISKATDKTIETKASNSTETIAKDSKTVKAVGNAPVSKAAEKTKETKKEDPNVTKTLDTEVVLNLSIDEKLEVDHVNYIREEFIFPLVNREAFVSAGFSIHRGLILHGSSHGMHTFVKGFANELSRLFGKTTRIFSRTPLDLFRRYSDDAENFMARIRESVKKCNEDIPIIILLEELRSCLAYCDVLRYDSGSFTALTGFLKTFLAENSKNQRIFIIATVDDVKIVPKVLREPGMLKKTLHFPGAANAVRRKYFLKEAVKKWKVQPEDKLLDEMAEKTEGFSAEELQEFAQTVLRSTVHDKIRGLLKDSCSKCCALPDSWKAKEDLFESVNPTTEQWEKIFKTLQKTCHQNTNACAAADINFSTVGGLDEQIKYLRENIIVPLKHKDVLKEWGVEPVKGIIFHGPPGTGKTLLAKAMVNELDKIFEDQPATSAESPDENVPKTTVETAVSKKKYSFFYRKSTDCFNKYVGESERILRELFSTAQKQAPSVIFFDEFDGLCPTRTSSTFQFYTNIVTTLLGLMDSVERGDILIIAATNRLDSLDPAIRRAGRFDRAIGFPMPGKEGRESILEIHTKTWKNGNSKEILEQMAEKTVGYSGADLEQLARGTLILGMQKFLQKKTQQLEVVLEDWHTALSQTKPSNNSGEIAFGNGSTFLQRVPEGVKLLLESNMTKIDQKLQPIFTAIEESSKTNCSGGLNSFLISSGSENNDVDRYLVPLLLTESKLFKNVAPYTLDLSDIRTLTKKSVQATLAQLHSSPDGKIPLLLIPQIEMFIKLKNSEANAGGIVDYVLAQLQTIRGKNMLLLATSKVTLTNMQQNEEMLTLFKDVEGSKCHEFMRPSLQDLTSFFKTNTRLEKEFPKQLECAVKFGEGKDVETLLDLYAEVQRILQQKEGDENKTDKIILEQLTALLSAFDKHKKGQNHLDLYI